VLEASETTRISDDLQMAVWGDDAPGVWAQMSHEPARRCQNVVLVSATEDVRRVLAEHRTFSSGPEASFIGSDTGLIPLQVDPPEHVRYRRMLDPLFAPKRMAALEQDVRTLAKHCIDSFAQLGYCNFSEEFAVPLPAGTFLHLLGLPITGLTHLLDLKDRIIRPRGDTIEEMTAIRSAAGNEIAALFDSALDVRRVEPTDDILNFLTEAEQACQLSREESINICHLLLIAGLDTVTGALETSFALLARRPDLQAALSSRPDILPTAVEELLRWSVTSPMQNRVATATAEVEGCSIQAGDLIHVVNGTINFDAHQIEDPLTVNLDRPNNPHASFGLGVHRCLGSHLARMEMRVALEVWHSIIPQYDLEKDCQVRYSPVLREIPDLRLTFDPAI
jgi:cytochrome P450